MDSYDILVYVPLMDGYRTVSVRCCYKDTSSLYAVVRGIKGLALSRNEEIILFHNSREIRRGQSIAPYGLRQSSVPVRMIILNSGLKGGKGGFGALLRSSGKSGGKKTTDFGACRDLSGRRLRHINDEIRLRKWTEAKNRRNERETWKDSAVRSDDEEKEDGFDVKTSSGIKGWHLTIPSWAEGFKPKKSDHARARNRRKTVLCEDWLRARAHSRPPTRAPKWWGCPRGMECEFAHGDDELQGEGKLQWEQTLKERKLQTEAESVLSVIDELDQSKSLSDAVKEGLERSIKAAKRGRPTCIIPLDVTDPYASSNTKGSSKWLIKLSGKAQIASFGEVQGLSKFCSVGAKEMCPRTGRWYYEVQLLTDGLMQIGWANNETQLNSDSGDGVGDDDNSWAFDGMRIMFWNGKAKSYGRQWSVGDVIGCFLDLDERKIRFSLNGDDLGVAAQLPVHTGPLFPAVSLEEDEAIVMNLGDEDFVQHSLHEMGFSPIARYDRHLHATIGKDDEELEGKTGKE